MDLWATIAAYGGLGLGLLNLVKDVRRAVLCPHAAIREDISHNLLALEELMEEFHPQLLFVESGGDNLAAQYSRELADYTVYVIDVAGGDKVLRKGGPGITQSDLPVINKTDLAPQVGADLGVMERDARRLRGSGPIVFAQCTHGVGIDRIAREILDAWTTATRPSQPRSPSQEMARLKLPAPGRD